MSRLSLAGPVQRRSSAHNPAKGSGVKSDPRPVSDKQFQANCARTIIAYLATHNYEHQINLKMLAAPQTKDVHNIMLFLLRRVDPLTAKGALKLDEEMISLFARLRYPFRISKSSLTAPTTPHTWPSILAALAWLVELLDYQARAEQTAAAAGGEEAALDAEFLDYVVKAYHYHMAFQDDLRDAVYAAKAAEYEDRATQVAESTEQLAAQREELEAKVAQAQARRSALPDAKRLLEERRVDREKLQQYIASLQAQKVSQERRVTERTSDAAALNTELEGVKRECEALRSRLARQTVQPADIQRMAAERVAVEAELRGAQAARRAGEEGAARAEQRLGAALDGLENALRGYDSRARDLQLVPATAKRGGAARFEVSWDRGAVAAGTAPATGDADWRGVLRPALGALRDAAAARARDLLAERVALQEAVAAAAEVAAEREREANAESARVQSLERELTDRRCSLDAQSAEAGRRVQALRAEVAALRGAGGADVAASADDLRAAQATLEEAARRSEAADAGLRRDLAAVLETILQHKMRIQDKLAGAAARMRRGLDECRASAIATA